RSLQQPAFEWSHLAAPQASQFLRLRTVSNRCRSRRFEISAPSEDVSGRKDTEWIELVLYCSHDAQLQSRHLKGKPAALELSDSVFRRYGAPHREHSSKRRLDNMLDRIELCRITRN